VSPCSTATPSSRGFQAAALKPADFFGNNDVLYLMEDMATGEIRVSILWEWLHKGAQLNEDDPKTGARPAIRSIWRFLPAYSMKNTRSCSPPRPRRPRRFKDDHAAIAREIVATYVTNRTKLPWYIDLLNLN